MPFTQKFSSYTNLELMQIIDRATDYQPEAVDAAKHLLHERNLNDADMELLRAQLGEKNQAEEAAAHSRETALQKRKEYLTGLVNLLLPLQHPAPRSVKTIRIASLLFACMSLLFFYQNSSLIVYVFNEGVSGWDFSVLSIFIPLIFLPVGTYFFYRLKRSGWLLLSVYLSYELTGILLVSIHQAFTKPTEIPALKTILQHPPLAASLLVAAFYAGLLFSICRPNIRQVFHIHYKHMLLYPGITAAGITLLYISLFLAL